MASRPTVALVAAILTAGLAVGAVGCGSSGSDDATTPAAPAASVETPPPPTATAPADQPTAEPQVLTATTDTTATTEPDAGDEEGIRVPATFALGDDGALSPPQVTVPPQLPIAVTVTAQDGQAHTIVFSTAPEVTVEVPAGGAGTARIPGQRKGTYTASVDGAAAVPALVAVDDAGP